MNEFKLDLSASEQSRPEGSSRKKTKVPRWLIVDSYSLSVRPELPIDSLEEDGTALDTVRHRPGHKFKISKRVGKRLAEAEEWVDFLKKKGRLGNE